MLVAWLTWITRILTILVVTVFALPFVWETGSRDTFMTVTGRSMEPTYQVGDVLSVRPPTGHDLETIGEPVVVAFTPGDASTQYVHRVHSLVEEGARLKGDNNETIDPGVVNESDVMGTPRFAMTGAVASLFHTTQSWVARAIVAVAVVTVIFLPGVRPGRHRGTKTRATVKDPNPQTGDERLSEDDSLTGDESVFADLFRKGAAGCVALLAALAISVLFEPTAASATPPPASVGPAFEVTPAQGLFDITLAPGETERAIATVTNRSDEPLRVTIDASTASWVGADSPSDHILLGAATEDGCRGDGPALPYPVNAMANHFVGVVAPGATTEVCMAAHLPASTSMAGLGASIVHIAFTGMSVSQPAMPGFALPATGSVVSWPLVVAIVAMLCAGVLLLVCRRREDQS